MKSISRTFSQIVLLLAIAAGTQIFFSCSEEPTPSLPSPPPPAVPDTTTHEYEFTLYEVSGGGSIFFDVCALSPDFVLAVGRFQVISGLSYTNAYLWNGMQMEPRYLPINPYDTATINPPREPRVELRSIWAFRRDNIWYGSDIYAMAHLTTTGKDTNIYNLNYITRSDASSAFSRRIWAKDTSELYFGGMEGTIYRYKNKEWKPMSVLTYSGDITDLWGFDSNNIWMVSLLSPDNNPTFYRYNGAGWDLLWQKSFPSLSDSVFFGAPMSVWGSTDEDSVWVAGLHLGRMKKDGTGKVRVVKDIKEYGYYRIRGSSKNNIFFAGADGTISHYNGSTFRDYTLFRNQGISLLSVAVLPKDVYLVGARNGNVGIFIHGKQK